MYFLFITLYFLRTRVFLNMSFDRFLYGKYFIYVCYLKLKNIDKSRYFKIVYVYIICSVYFLIQFIKHYFKFEENTLSFSYR